MTQVLVEETRTDGVSAEGAFLSAEALRRGNFDRGSFGSMHEYANAIVRHVATSQDVTLIDLATARQWTNEDVYDDLHFTETGSRHAADIIAGVLGRHIVEN